MIKKYLLLPGRVESKTDGQFHYVGILQLMRLYGVDSRECVVAGLGMDTSDLIRLRPRYDGDYRLPSR